MQRLALKLNKPGGEERIRQKIQKFLRRVPSQFSECDEDRREFREQLPDNIIKKLKKIYQKPEKKRYHHTSPVRVLRIEVPKCENKRHKDNDALKGLINKWLKEIPMKNKDFLGRSIRKEEVLESVVNKIEPYILNRHNFDKDYEQTLKQSILDILNEMPVEMTDSDKTPFLNNLAISLVHDLDSINITNYDKNQMLQDDLALNIQDVNEVTNFVVNEIATIVNKLHLNISTKRMGLLEQELKDAFMKINAISPEDDVSESSRDTVYIILHILGGLSNYQANYFTDILLKLFKEEVQIKQFYRNNRERSGHSSSLPEVIYNETYSVYHGSSTIKSNKIKFKTSNENDSNYKQKLIEQIEEWLTHLHIQIPFRKSDRNRAVNELAEDVMDRFKYLELDPAAKVSEENELQYLKYQIFKWINKIAGENTRETIERAEELMNRIQAVSTNISSKEVDNSQTSPTLQTSETNDNTNILSLLKDIIGDWVNEHGLAVNNIDDLATALVSIWDKSVKSPKNFDTLISAEVEKWTSRDMKIKNKFAIEKLKDKLIEVFNANYTNVDSKQKKICIRKYEDIIDDWMDTVFLKVFGETLDYKNRNEHIHDFATRAFETLSKSKSNESKTYLEIIAVDWLEQLPLGLGTDKELFQRECISKLVQLLINCALKESQMNNDQNKEETVNIIAAPTDIAKRLILDVHNENVIGKESNQINMTTSNTTVYGVTLPNSSQSRKKTNKTNTSVKQISDDDIEANKQSYLKQLIVAIDDWISTLKVPQNYDKGFRKIVVNDLASDIIDRQKYLELHPNIKVTDKNELETLRYQIFKWINKLVGENQQETVDSAPTLMNRIRAIPVPMMVKGSDLSGPSTEVQSPGRKKSASPSPKVTTASNRNQRTPSSVRLSSPLGFTTGPMANTSQNVNLMSSVTPKKQDVQKNAVSSGNSDMSVLNSPKLSSNEDSKEFEGLPPGMTLEEVYNHYETLFKQRIQELEFDTSDPVKQQMSDLARQALYNGIWHNYFHLKSDPEIENDYSHFELLFEDKLDNMLDVIQTEAISKMRTSWTSKVVADVMEMLKYVHSITDTPSFREELARHLDRKFAKLFFQKLSNEFQKEFVVRIADEYILMSKYKEEDLVKANIYRQRLMKRIEELADAVKKQENTDFRNLNVAQLHQMALQALESVPLPQDGVLKDEVEEILIGEEIEQWYNGLPVAPMQYPMGQRMQKRTREHLAKKLCDLEKGNNIDDSSTEQNMKHEVSVFLQGLAKLMPAENVNIDFMVEALTNRLKNRKQQNMLGYESFANEPPVSSTFVETEPGEVLGPLVDIDVNGPQDPRQISQAQQKIRQGLHVSQEAGPSGYIQPEQAKLQPANQANTTAPRSQDYRPENQANINSPCCQKHPLSNQSNISGQQKIRQGSPNGYIPPEQPKICGQDYSSANQSNTVRPSGQVYKPVNQANITGPRGRAFLTENQSNIGSPCCQDHRLSNQENTSGQQKMKICGPRGQDYNLANQANIICPSSVENRANITGPSGQGYLPENRSNMGGPCCQNHISSNQGNMSGPSGQEYLPEKQANIGGPRAQEYLPANQANIGSPCCQNPLPLNQANISGPSDQANIPADQANMSGPRGQDYFPSNIPNMPPRQRPVIMGTSQIAGPSQGFDPAYNQGSYRRSSSPGRIDDVSYVSSSRVRQQQPNVNQIGGAAMERSFASAPRMESPRQVQSRGGRANVQGPSQEGQNEQVFGQGLLSTGQAQGPSLGSVSRDRSPTGATGATGETRSTARVDSPTLAEVVDDEFNEEDEEEVRYKCRCLERVWKCRKRHMGDDGFRSRQRYIPMPFPPCPYYY